MALTEFELPTDDSGSVYMVRGKGSTEILLSVTDRWRADASQRSCGCDSAERERGEVYLTTDDALAMIVALTTIVREIQAT